VPPALSVVPNGLAFSAWMPSASRKREVICVGRAAPEKGIVETAEAMAAFLANRPDWRGRLILSEPNRFPGYMQTVMQAIAPVRSRVEISLNQPLSEVCARYREAAIAVVASRWTEPFGRAALEAHAAGCAVISSGTGGLREISGKEALMLPPGFTAMDIAGSIEILAGDENLRNGIAERGRARCQERFAIKEVSAAADAFYEHIVLAEYKRSRVYVARKAARSVDCGIVDAAVKTSPTRLRIS
jgi:glycosyltransferase involved in cell wall biosynthesis